MKPDADFTGIYQHYKGNQYEVIAIGHHEETHEELVVYRALHDLSQVWIRPKDIFFSHVTHDGKEMPRFKLVSNSIDYSDIPETDEEFWKDSEVNMP